VKEFLVVIEKAESNYSAYCPDLPGCVATGKTPAEVKRRMQSTIRLHLEGLAEDGLPVPEPEAKAEYLPVPV
jgi:predicted RNase H-like HicB family nuclease